MSFNRSIYCFQYLINPTDHNYINAIALHNKKAYVKSINDEHQKNKRCDKLPTILQNQYQSKKIVEVTVLSENSATTVGVLPPFDSNKIVDSLLQLELSDIDVDAEKINIIGYNVLSYIDSSLFLQVADTIPMLSLRKNESVTMYEAFMILSAVDKQLDKALAHTKITGAMHFASLQQIIFQVDDINFLFSYGEQFDIEKLQDFCLDMDNGFYCHEPKQNLKPILSELQVHFTQWKEKGRKGPVICQDAAHFTSQIQEVKIDLQNMINKSDCNPFLRSFNPKQKTLRTLLQELRDIKQVEKSTKYLEEIIEDWLGKNSRYGRNIIKNNQQTIVPYTNRELLGHHRHFLFGKNRDGVQTSTDEDMDHLVNKYGRIPIR